MANTWKTIETAKSPMGIATIKVGETGKMVKVTFEDGSIDKKFERDDLPEYPKNLKSGKYFVVLSNDKSEVTRIAPANLSVPVTVKCIDFVRPEEGADPEPREYKNEKKNYSYRAFIALLEIQEGFFKNCQVPLFLHYKFIDDGSGMAGFKGNISSSPRLAQLVEFLEFTGALDEPLEWEDNILPALLNRIKVNKREFKIIIKKGYVDSLLECEYDFEDDFEGEDEKSSTASSTKKDVEEDDDFSDDDDDL